MDKQGIIIPPPPPPQWIPRLEGIKEIVAVLSDSLIPETSKQREVYEVYNIYIYIYNIIENGAIIKE